MSLRLDTLQAMDAGNPNPIGTLNEIRKEGLRPVKYGSCSQPSQHNIGCKHYNSEQWGPCPILELCRAKGRKGFENVAFVHMLSPTVVKQDAMLCHQYMDTMHHKDPRSGVVQILGLGGETFIKRKISYPADPKDPRSSMVTTLKREEVPRAKRPNESMADHVQNMELVRDLEARNARQNVEQMNAAAHARNFVPEEDKVEQADELEQDPRDTEENFSDEVAITDGDDVLNEEDESDVLDSILDDDGPEPEAVASVSGKGKGKKGRG